MCRCNQRHSFEHLEPALRLARFRGLVAKPIDEALDVLNVLLLARIHGLLLRKLFCTLRFKLAVVAGKELQLSIFNVSDARTDLVEKIPVMRYHQEDSFVALKPALQP